MSDPLTTLNSVTQQAPLCVYFDGSCPVCTAEIGIYRRAAAPEAVQFVDLAQTDACLPDGATRGDLLARFHVRDTEGRLVAGAQGFVALWLAIPKFRWLGRIGSWPPVTALLEFGYRVFLRIRPLWRHSPGATSP
jgi:predicted DCC family thiol-disulfide oxidoreductase YuxK